MVGATLSVTVTAAATGYAPLTQNVAVGIVTAPALEVTDEPVVTGTPVVGETLTAVPGAYSVANTAESVEWLRDGAVVARGSRTYQVPARDAGHRVTARVTASAPGHTPVTTSIAVGDVQKFAAPPTAAAAKTNASAGAVATEATSSKKRSAITADSIRPPVITARGKRVTPATKVRKGTKLKVTMRSVSAPTATISYRWLRGTKTIKGATKRTYIVKRRDVGKKLRVKVTVAVSGSAAVKIVTAATPKVR